MTQTTLTLQFLSLQDISLLEELKSVVNQIGEFGHTNDFIDTRALKQLVTKIQNAEDYLLLQSVSEDFEIWSSYEAGIY